MFLLLVAERADMKSRWYVALFLAKVSPFSDARQIPFAGTNVWSGPILDATGTDNLKIRPEFFPGLGDY
ncbi:MULTISPECIES: hypothetical protein [Photobacterium]|uniref:Uncharacterized protein n=1 Tax=Photobacterium halotolerans TaxID=265726 RepID=A0A0F5VE66_9GAMM|nr:MULTISPECIES: hypothetical protein [Photobacterium]KKD00424.1 hypothetical protein KY46_07225 [Photobacterium halotolerans]UIP29609.1 hypothetical protein LN341_18740 [Photobacterium sp. TLY01]